jgi:predicted transcriptional regulator
MYAPNWVLDAAKAISGDIVNALDRGAVIQSYRNRMEITQEELSGIMQLRRETISRIENGRVTPTLAFIHKFSGVATLMEAVRSFRSMNNAIDYPYFIRVGAEIGVPQDKITSIVDAAVQNYDKKRKKAIRFLEK